MPATYQAKIKEAKDIPYLGQYAQLFSRLERKLFTDLYIRRKPLTELKKYYIKNHQIVARQFNSLHADLKGKVTSIEEVRDQEISNLEGRIKSVRKWLAKKERQKAKLAKQLTKKKIKKDKDKFSKIVKNYRSLKFAIHNKKRKLRNLMQKLTKLKKDLQAKKVRLCFGSRKLFKAQHNLEANGYKSHEEWQKDWREARASQFFILGSKDENGGNQNCAYNLNNTLRLRIADCFTKQYKSKFLILKDVTFPYGQQVLEKVRKARLVNDDKGKFKKECQAISYRFVRKDGNWYVNATTEEAYPKVTTNKWNGAIGVDINDGFLVAGEIDRYGNLLQETKIPVLMHDRSSHQITAAIGDAVKQIVQLAKAKGRPIVIENLDFDKKKRSLGEASAKYARMLSGFTYSKFNQIITSQCARNGVELISRNPFATSLAGQFNYMARSGLSSHGAAACVIARRGLGFDLERLPKDTVIKLPELKRHKSRGSRWASISKTLKNNLPFYLRIALLSADR